MEPRPQRPRTVGGQPAAAGATPGGYPPEEGDPATLIAPSRTEYDYSPLDLAPPGQRRRRQIVAGAVGLLTLLLLGAIGVFAYLLVRDPEPAGRSSLAASQTEVVRAGATVAAQQTLVAASAAQETADAGGAPASSPDAAGTAAGSPGAAERTGRTPAADDATRQATEPRVAIGAGAGGDEAPTAEDLAELLPDAEVVPEELSSSEDNRRTFEQVAEALGGANEPEVAEQLEGWGWSGNVERTFSAPDPGALDAEATTVLLTSIHGFAGEEAAGEALTFYADTLEALGHQDEEAPDLGDSTRQLRTEDAEGTTTVSLYVQQGSAVYRIVGISPGGDPATVVADVAERLLERNA